MHYCPRTLTSLAENLALDEALLLEAEAGRGGEVLRLWEWPVPAVVLGSGCRQADDVHETACRADGVPILRRASGGGTVLLGKGCLLFSLVLAYERAEALREVRPSYGYILEIVRAALVDVVPGIVQVGISDLAVADRKFSGNSQQRKRNFLLHHGTLLYDFAFEKIERYLALPARQPDYRRRRGHIDFLMNLPASSAELERRLRTAWDATGEARSWPETAVARLVQEKYATEAWNRLR